MRKYAIYQNMEKRELIKAVKIGFSWPGFFFGALWAFAKRLPAHGVVLVLIIVPLNVAADFSEEIVQILFYNTTTIIIGAATGVFGNGWIIDKLLMDGFRPKHVIEAKTAVSAMMAFKNEADKITNEK